MNITDALYRAAHEYPGGIQALAMRMGISSSSLAHKVSSNYPSAHCSPNEVAQICEFTRDHSPLQALASQLGYMLLPIASETDVDGEFTERLAQTCKAFGEFIAEISADLSDGKITDNELKRIERDLAEMVAASSTLYAVAARSNREAKPTHLRAP